MFKTRSPLGIALMTASALALALALVTPGALLAQSTGATLSGRATDDAGQPLPGASITATHVSTGLTRTGVTGSDGSFRLLSLPAGTYDVVAQLQGFKKVEKKGVTLNVAVTRNVDFTLSLASIEAVVSVTSEAALVKSEPTIGAVISQDELENLPLNGRQFANLAVLAPGTALSYNSDPTKPGQLTIALNGGIGRNVNFTIDGGDNTDDTIGGALQNFSIEGVQEFNIQTQQYKAEYGRSTGGVLSVVTKTGSNDFRGSAFAFFRNRSLNGVTESERLNGGGVKGDYERYQYGASLGGPIVKDKAHFFGTFELTRRDTSYQVATGGLFPAVDGQKVPLKFEDDLISAKASAEITPKQFLQVRFGYQRNADKYGASPLTTPDALGTVDNKYTSILGSHTTQIGSSSVNEFLFQYTRFENTISADSNLPTIIYPSGVTSGQNINTPQSTEQTKYQFKDDFSFSKDLGGQRHDFKVGFNVVHEPVLGGDFSSGLVPQYTLLEDRVGSPVIDITQNGGFFGNKTPVNQYSVYLQDDWRPTNRLTINVGVRYDLWRGFDLDQRSNPIWQTLSTQTTYNEYYLRDFQGGKGGVLENDNNNFSPRLGLSYDVTGKAKTFVRGGFGIYYDFPYTNATILFPAAAVQSNYGVIYNNANATGIRNANGTFFQPGQPLPPNQITGGGAPPPNEVASPTIATPFSRQASLSVSHEILPWLSGSLELVKIAYRDIPYRFRANPRTGPGQPRRFSQFANFRIWYGDGFADYEGANLTVQARISNRLTVQGFYTLSKVDGNVLAGADEFRLSNTTYQPDLGRGRDVSVNPLDPGCDACVGPLNTDARHRFTIGFTYQAPYAFTFGGVIRYRSATPYNVHAGVDLNGDGFVIDLPAGVTNVNSGRADSFSQVDLRLSRDFKFTDTLGVELIAEVFNLFNATNPAGFRGDRTATDTNGNSLFGKPSTYAGDPLQGEQRLIQFGARFHF